MSSTAPPTPEEVGTHELLNYHFSLLRHELDQQELQEASTAPIFTMPVLDHAEQTLFDGYGPRFPQYGLLAGLVESFSEEAAIGEEVLPSRGQDPRIFFNVASPSSTFICGSQGSGKSHTLSCLLESCLLPSDASKLPHPLASLDFHYDTFIADDGGSPCEAAQLQFETESKLSS